MFKKFQVLKGIKFLILGPFFKVIKTQFDWAPESQKF